MNKSQPEYLPERAVLFDDCRYIDAMPALLKAKLSPVSPDWVIDMRNANKNPNHSFWTNYFDTDMGIAGTPNKVLVLPHSTQLRKVTAKTEVTDGGVELDGSEDAKSYDRRELILGQPLTEEQAHKHDLLLAIAGGNQKRHDEYVTNVFKFGKDKFGLDKMMGAYICEDGKLRPLVLDGLNIDCDADGGRGLGNYDARLVGVQTEVAEGDSAKNYEKAPSGIYVPKSKELARLTRLTEGVQAGQRPAKDLEHVLEFLAKFRKD